MKRPVRILACLFVGAVTSLGVAWGLELFGATRPPSTGPQHRVDLDLPPPENWRWLVNHHFAPGHRLYIFRRARTKTPEERRRVESKDQIHHAGLPAWVDRPTRGMYHEAHAFGLPFLCVARKESNSSAPDFIRIRTGTRRVRAVALPVRPIPIGLLADTICYAIVWWPLLAAPGRLRRRWRRRQGRCAGCGYDLHGSQTACPECGAPPYLPV